MVMLLYQRVISFHVHLYQYQYLYNTKIYIYIYIIYIYYLISIHPWPLDPHFQASMPRLASTRKRLITGRNSSSGISEMDPPKPHLMEMS